MPTGLILFYWFLTIVVTLGVTLAIAEYLLCKALGSDCPYL